MSDVSRRSLVGLLGASIAASHLTLLVSGCGSASRTMEPDSRLGWHITGLSFLPTDMADIRAFRLDAFICDISAIEQVV